MATIEARRQGDGAAQYTAIVRPESAVTWLEVVSTAVARAATASVL